MYVWIQIILMISNAKVCSFLEYVLCTILLLLIIDLSSRPLFSTQESLCLLNLWKRFQNLMTHAMQLFSMTSIVRTLKHSHRNMNILLRNWIYSICLDWTWIDSCRKYTASKESLKPFQNKKGQRDLRYPTKKQSFFREGLLFCRIPQIFLALLILKRL